MPDGFSCRHPEFFERPPARPPREIRGWTAGGDELRLREKLAGRMNPVIRVVGPQACLALTRGTHAYDFCDATGFTPLLKMHTLGHDFAPDPIHADGLRYHGMPPLLSHMYEPGMFEAGAKSRRECFGAGPRFARTEGIVPAPEPTHAPAETIAETLRRRESGEPKVLPASLCGHGHFDLNAYDRCLSGRMEDFALPQGRALTAVSHASGECLEW
ncbi:hypothetical protein [Streptosporangium sp. NPDC000396]|uniref:hypothetical protein n=1 Tax=Streptosporangium sp. NPDC000396 TaxID=3366185 RepID=UPI0036B2D4E0